MRRDAALAHLDQVRKDAAAGAAAAEVAALQEDKARLEQRIASQGFARAIADVEADLRRAAETQPRTRPSAADAVLTKEVLAAAGALLERRPAEILAEAAPRLGQYLEALTDRRIVSGKLDSRGQVLFSAPDGKTGALDAMPGPLRDLAYSALRLCLLEKVASSKRLPIFVDDSFAVLDPRKRAMVAKMLKAIAAHTQIIHRIPDALPQGIADHVVQA